MDKPPILTKEGVLTRTPGMINKEKIDNATKKEVTAVSSTESGLIKREQAKEKDATKIEKIKENLGKAFSKEGLLNRNFGK